MTVYRRQPADGDRAGYHRAPGSEAVGTQRARGTRVRISGAHAVLDVGLGSAAAAAAVLSVGLQHAAEWLDTAAAWVFAAREVIAIAALRAGGQARGSNCGPVGRARHTAQQPWPPELMAPDTAFPGGTGTS